MKVSEGIAKAKAEIGVCEVPANSNNVKYNTWYYGKNVSGPEYPWCCAFISWLFRSEQKLCKKTASCADLLDWFTQKNRVVKTPRPGDIVFFKFSTNNRKTNHVGFVIGVDGNIIITIEGNTSVTSNDNGGRVMQRRRDRNIVAYARPEYSDAAAIPVLKLIDVIAKEVIDGKWGNGTSRKQRLTSAGYNYDEVQKKVNTLLEENK